MTLKGQGGLAELVEAFVPLPLWMTVLAVATLAFALMWSLLRMRRWLDPDGISGASVRWALSSRSLNSAVVSGMAIVFLLRFGWDSLIAWLGGVDPGFARFVVSWWWLILLSAIAVLGLLAPLYLFNPQTLARDRLSHWWRPFWPGLIAILAAASLWYGLPFLTQWLQNLLPGVDASPWRWLSDAAEFVLASAAELVAVVCLLCRGGWPDIRASIARLFRFDALRRYLALELLWSALFLVALVVAMTLTVFDVYIAPQYAEWKRTGLVATPPMLDALISPVHWLRVHQEAFIAMSFLLDTYLLFSLGRLLVRIGADPPRSQAKVACRVDGSER